MLALRRLPAALCGRPRDEQCIARGLAVVSSAGYLPPRHSVGAVSQSARDLAANGDVRMRRWLGDEYVVKSHVNLRLSVLSR